MAKQSRYRLISADDLYGAVLFCIKYLQKRDMHGPYDVMIPEQYEHLLKVKSTIGLAVLPDNTKTLPLKYRILALEEVAEIRRLTKSDLNYGPRRVVLSRCMDGNNRVKINGRVKGNWKPIVCVHHIGE